MPPLYHEFGAEYEPNLEFSDPDDSRAHESGGVYEQNSEFQREKIPSVMSWIYSKKDHMRPTGRLQEYFDKDVNKQEPPTYRVRRAYPKPWRK